jgi:hypothetical protein
MNYPKEALSTQEVKDLYHIREEEKLARDVYITLYNKWGLRVFRNISRSEEYHMQMVKSLLDKYSLKDPINGIANEVGVFNNPKIQSLYNELVRKGSKSVVDALKVGALIEDLDIKDLTDAIERSDNKDIVAVYKRLRMGSTNHMRAFVRFLRRYGSDYTPKYISNSMFKRILKK